jgi:hypothetical protein
MERGGIRMHSASAACSYRAHRHRSSAFCASVFICRPMRACRPVEALERATLHVRVDCTNATTVPDGRLRGCRRRKWRRSAREVELY